MAEDNKVEPLPFDGLPPRDFERLCLLLVEREGYERAEHRGPAGSEQARDLVAWRGAELWAFQCKRVPSFDLEQALAEVKKNLAFPSERRPAGLVFLVTCDVKDDTRRKVREHCAVAGLACHFWAGAEVDQRVNRHPDVVDEFFAAGRVLAGAVKLPTLEQVAAYRAALAQELAGIRVGVNGSIGEADTLLPIETLPYDPKAPYRRENLLDLVRAAPRLLVLGEPGSGKTVALQRLAWELATDGAGVVPVLLPLRTYAGDPLLALVRAELQRTGALRFDGLRAVGALLAWEAITCHFLLDGLNEVPPDQRDHLVEELFRLLRAHPRHRATVTGGCQDESWRCLRVGGVVAGPVVVQPLAERQVRSYLAAQLGRERGVERYRGLGGSLRGQARRPLNLWLIEEAASAGGDMPGSRGELYDGIVARLLDRAGVPGLLPTQRDVLPLALSQLAFQMHRRQTLVVTRAEAEPWLKAGLLQAAADHGLLAGADPLRFAPHETMQDYFAAVALGRLAASEAQDGPLTRAGRALRRAAGRGTTDLQTLARDDRWAETFAQLAGLVPAAGAGPLGRTVACANPCLAWRCVEEGLAADDTTRTWIEGRAARSLRSWRVGDRRRAVRMLARMQSGRAVALLFRAAADSDAEVAGLAARALAGRGRPARAAAAAALAGTDRRPWWAALRYLAARLQTARSDERFWAEIPSPVWETVLGQPMVWVPPGPFLMGSDRTRDRHALDEELPRHEVNLPGYWIGRFPVTVARFRAFVKASGHKLGDADSLKGPDDHPAVNVRWRDALAYCRWLADESGLPVRLPNEAEWEKAARGPQGSIYPWGDEWNPHNCNSGEGGRGGTTPVGTYSPHGDSPYGSADVAGNVWEWTQSLHCKYPYNPNDGREKVDDNGARVLRGGAFYVSDWLVRCAYRLRYSPSCSLKYVGFRVVVAPDSL